MRKILETDNRTVTAINIKNATRIAILFNAEKPEQVKQVIQLNKDLTKQYPQIEIHFLGWFKKELPKIPEKLPNITLFSKADYDFFCKPKLEGPVLKPFVSREYDILLDLSMEFVLPIKRILLNINTSLRVGIFSEENEPLFDLFIQTQSNVADFSKHAVHYLSIINKQ